MSERYAEAFYGVIMVTGCTGMVSLADPSEASVELMLFTAILVNVLWGIIDGLTVVFGNLVNNLSEDKAVRALRTGYGSPKDVIDGLDDSLVSVLVDEDRLEVADIIRTSRGYMPMQSRLVRDDLLKFLAIFSIDFFAVFWVALPYVFTTDVVVAARISFVIATGIMFFLGYKWAKYARMRRLVIALAFSIFTIALLGISYALGGI
jgi:hypothetical protein